MVLGLKNMEDVRSSKRTRMESPNTNNGHIYDGSSDDSDQDNGMRVGNDFQAFVPHFDPDIKPESRPEAMLVWAPHPDLAGQKVDEYVNLAKEKHGYNMEQALGMLFWHKHNVDKALVDLANFTPFPDEWTVEDKVLFEQAFSFHGKSFHRIRQMLPDKPVSTLVKYYYSWKKTRARTSLMDRQARKLNQKAESDEEMETTNHSDSDTEPNNKNAKEDIRNGPNRGPPGSKKPDIKGYSSLKKKKPPRGMYLDQDSLTLLATGPPNQGEAILKHLDAEIVALKRTVQNNKQVISVHKNKASAGISAFRPPETNTRINARWTNDELLLAVQGIRKYGKNFKAISEVIGNKTESHVRNFSVTYRRKYNLDEVFAQYESEFSVNGTIKNSEDTKMDVDSKVEEIKPNNSNTSSVPAALPASASTSPSSPPTLAPNSSPPDSAASDSAQLPPLTSR